MLGHFTTCMKGLKDFHDSIYEDSFKLIYVVNLEITFTRTQTGVSGVFKMELTLILLIFFEWITPWTQGVN